MSGGLLDPVMVSVMFAPLTFTVAVFLGLLWRRMRSQPAGFDGPGSLLASAVSTLPEPRTEWGAAMLSELGAIHGTSARWTFALGCTQAALLAPPAAALPVSGRSPIFGLLSVSLPPLGLPFLYCASVIIETIGGSPYTSASQWSNPGAVMALVKVLLVLTLGCLGAGVPLGIVAWLRSERLRRLISLGMASSVGTIVYFATVMHLLAGGE